MRRLAALPGVKPIDGDQCIGGGPYKKPTRWLTNAPWLEVLAFRCPGQPEHSEHITLEGFTEAEDGSRCWLTEQAPEYSSGLWDVIAEAYMQDSTPAPFKEPPRTKLSAYDVYDP